MAVCATGLSVPSPSTSTRHQPEMGPGRRLDLGGRGGRRAQRALHDRQFHHHGRGRRFFHHHRRAHARFFAIWAASPAQLHERSRHPDRARHFCFHFSLLPARAARRSRHRRGHGGSISFCHLRRSFRVASVGFPDFFHPSHPDLHSCRDRYRPGRPRSAFRRSIGFFRKNWSPSHGEGGPR